MDMTKERKRRKKSTVPPLRPYPEMRSLCEQHFSAKTKAEKDRIFSQHLYAIFLRMADYNYIASAKPGLPERDSLIADVISSMYEALCKNFDPMKSDNPWYYFNRVCAHAVVSFLKKNANIRKHERLARDDRHAEATLANLTSLVANSDDAHPSPEQLYIAAEPPEPGFLFETIFKRDPLLSAAIVSLDSDDFTSKGLNYLIRTELSGTVPGFDKRLKNIRAYIKSRGGAQVIVRRERGNNK